MEEWLTLIGMSSESMKNALLLYHLGTMSLSGCQIQPIDVNFHLQKSSEIFDKNQLPKSDSKRTRVVESALPHAN